MFVAEENVDFRIHVENQTRARDDVSRKQLRLYQLYSRTSGKHIQVLGRRISAKGEDGDKYALDACEKRWAIHCSQNINKSEPWQILSGSKFQRQGEYPVSVAPSLIKEDHLQCLHSHHLWHYDPGRESVSPVVRSRTLKVKSGTGIPPGNLWGARATLSIGAISPV
ncbi:Fibroblast growth factor 18 [Chelonia mydas]|uniref:Fibroblast growth factor 18 n=1 Tax=Chelonia mydas TaxID=8469 RepID=M7AIB4_CHEMY|nr:Fibroblast growth factor 18 [Chelonia mydas]